MTQPEKVQTPCPSCGAKLSVPSTAAGKKIRCPKCQTIVAIAAEMVTLPPEMVAPPAALPKQVSGPEVSLGGENTFAGAPQKKYAPESLGDQATYGGGRAAGDDHFTDDMEIVDLAGRYKVEGVLGKGGMGEVQLATDTRLNRKVAIKRMLGDAAKSRTAVSRFLIEAKSIAALNHPNIVQIYDYGRAADGPFLIMEYVEGSSLLDKCRSGALELEEAIHLTCQLCDGLSKAHTAGIIHRDIKPANILLTADGVPKLTDFGLAKDETGDSGHTITGTVLGTLDFMPPEQRRDATKTDARSDLWSLAATLYQMVTGKSPKVIRLNDVARVLQDVLGKALEDAKEDRYQSVHDFRNALRSIETGISGTSGPSGELARGECLKCHATNDISRKFCRQCAVSLRVSCLQCEVEIPVWDQVCGECGCRQEERIRAIHAEMAVQQAEAVSRLKEYDFETALILAINHRDQTDLRFQHLKGWAEEFLPTIEQSRAQQLQWIASLLDEALAHEDAYDYSAGIHTLSQIPEILRTVEIPKHSRTIEDLFVQLKRKVDRCQELDEVIRRRVERRQLTGLQDDVDELLTFRPDRQDMQKLKQQLIDREAKLAENRNQCLAAATSLLTKQNYDEAIAVLEKVDDAVEADAIRSLRIESIEKWNRVQQLQRQIDKSVMEKRLHGLLKLVREYLTLKSYDTKMLALQDRLEERDRKNTAQVANVLEKAQSLRSQCQFEAAVKTLAKIPPELQTEESTGLQEECKALAEQRHGAVTALRTEIQTESYEKGLELAEAYATALKLEMLTDRELDQLLEICRRGLKDQQDASERTARQQALMKKLGMGAGALTVIALLIAVSLWVRSDLRASALADAVQQQQWDAALAIDPNHVPALIGRANQKLSSGTPDVAAVFTDLELAKRLNRSASGLQSAMGAAYAKRAKTSAEAGKIRDAEQDLQESEQLQASESLLTAARQSLAVAYMGDSDKAAQSGDASMAASRMAKAVGYDPSITVPASILEMWAEEAVKQFETSRQDVDKDAAVSAIAKLEEANRSLEKLSALRQRIGAVLMLRSETIKNANVVLAAEDYRTAVQVGASENRPLMEQLIKGLSTGGGQMLGRGNVESAITHYVLLRQLDAEAAISFSREFSKLPDDVLVKLPAKLILQLPSTQNSIGMAFKWLPAGNFVMGDGGKAHPVTLTQAFRMGVYEVTQEQYERVMGTNPSEYRGAQNPVEKVSWEDAVEFCRMLSVLPEERAAGRLYRLPTEAEWEYACRGGTNTEYSFGDEESLLDEYGWYGSNAGKSTHPVGQKEPNSWGLYDMHGNVWECCSDWYGGYPKGAVSDPVGPSDGSDRVRRGGSWYSEAAHCRSANRDWSVPSYRNYRNGFRVALSSFGIPQ